MVSLCLKLRFEDAPILIGHFGGVKRELSRHGFSTQLPLWVTMHTPEKAEVIGVTQTVEAIYERGLLRPLQPLEGVGEKSHVRLTIELDSRQRPGMFFDRTISLDEIALQQGVPQPQNIESLAGDFWPEDEDIDDFIASVREWRREGGV